jgi:hypothetical protein
VHIASVISTQQDEEATGGGTDHEPVPELREVHADALPRRDVEEIAAVNVGGEDLGEHDPAAGVKAAI